MKTIVDIKKKKETMIVTLEDGSSLEVTFDLAIKVHLAVGQTLDDRQWHELINENHYQHALNHALIKLKKMMSIHEMNDELLKEGFSQAVTKQVIHHLIDRHYLDDKRYADTYLTFKKMQEGPEMILYKLRQKGISETILDHLFHGYHEEDVIDSIAQNKLQHLKNKTKRHALMTIKQSLLQKGFHRETIERVIIRLEEETPSHDDDLIDQAYEKAYLQLSKKWSGYELHMKIKEKLYQKGFSYPSIQAIVEKKKLQSW